VVPRLFTAGALGGLIGHAEIFVSGGAEHQGPDGGGPVAVVVERSSSEGGLSPRSASGAEVPTTNLNNPHALVGTRAPLRSSRLV
jgi:Amidohydrolase ring-opening protein (Amido_AtzD_TrzD)